MLKNNIKIECKKTRINHLPIVYHGKKWAHSLMKRSMSCLGAPCTFMAIEIKWCPSWSPLYLWILIMALSYVIAPFNQLMTLVIIESCIESITTTSTTKTSSSWIMYRTVHNETPNIKVYHHSLHTMCPLFRTKAYITSLMVSCVTIH
jgi:hypothetical protein